MYIIVGGRVQQAFNRSFTLPGDLKPQLQACAFHTSAANAIKDTRAGLVAPGGQGPLQSPGATSTAAVSNGITGGRTELGCFKISKYGNTRVFYVIRTKNSYSSQMPLLAMPSYNVMDFSCTISKIQLSSDVLVID